MSKRKTRISSRKSKMSSRKSSMSPRERKNIPHIINDINQESIVNISSSEKSIVNTSERSIVNISSSDYQVDIDHGRLMPRQKIVFPKTWKEPKQQNNLRLYNAFLRKDQFPVFKRQGNELVVKSHIEAIPARDLMVEKAGYVTKEEKKAGLSVGSSGGQNVQIKLDSAGNYQGIYFQDSLQDKPINHWFKAKEIKVDSDDTGHNIAYLNNLYAFNNPFEKNVRFDGKGDLQSANELKAMRFHSKNILDTLATNRNAAVRDAIKADLGKSLVYRDASGVDQDVSVSDQQLQIVRYCVQTEANVEVQTAFQNEPIVFDFGGEAWKEKKPILYFEADKKEAEPINSDTLLRVAVKKMNLEPDSVQAMLEALYRADWINYPRADIIKAEDEPIHLKRDISEFKGSIHEKQLLQIIADSGEAYKRGENYAKTGSWVLKSGELELRKTDLTYGEVPTKTKPLADNQFDVSIGKRGRTIDDLTQELVRKEIGTPATRTALLSQLKQAGILTFQNGRYSVDRRGLYMAAAADFYKDNNIVSSVELKRKATEATSLEELQTIVNGFQKLDRQEVKKVISQRAQDFMELESDLTYLDEF